MAVLMQKTQQLGSAVTGQAGNNMQRFHLIQIDIRHDTLLLSLQPAPDPQQDLAALQHWLCSLLPQSQCHAEQNIDFCHIRFYFQQEPFLLTVEHYTDSCWVEAGSRGAFLLMSALAQALQPANAADLSLQGTST